METGIMLAYKMGFRILMVEGDSSKVFKAILEVGALRYNFGHFIQESKQCA